MTEPSPAQLERVRLLLAHEGASHTGFDAAFAAAQVFDKLHRHMAPLIGAEGVQALLDRSAKLTQPHAPFLDRACVESATTLRACLQAQPSAVAAEAAERLFGTFFALIITFIGERLTFQVLRRAWPTIDATAPGKPGR